MSIFKLSHLSVHLLPL
uniref:Uncharacterized protein n=1 Tax=Moniliophthora roreri TaxID=221103 RepID=A0A0W0F887_MONRR